MTKADLIRRGEKLTIAEIISQKLPPDQENFYADPIWMEMLETKSVLKNGEIVQEPKISSKDLLMRKFNSQLTKLEKDSISALRLSSPISTDRTEEEKTLMKELQKASSSTQLPIATEILQILDPIQPLANHLSELLRRPSAYYPTSLSG